MRVISKKVLKACYEKHPDAKTAILTWCQIVKNVAWDKPNDILNTFNTADVLKDNRAVFNLVHNKYRIVAWINYRRQEVLIKFIGTHKEYDKVDANTVFRC